MHQFHRFQAPAYSERKQNILFPVMTLVLQEHYVLSKKNHRCTFKNERYLGHEFLVVAQSVYPKS